MMTKKKRIKILECQVEGLSTAVDLFFRFQKQLRNQINNLTDKVCELDSLIKIKNKTKK